MNKHNFPYKWTLNDANFTKDKGTVFSCFACGGGSTMGYKLAGFDVLGCNEIDPKMIEAYKANHNPKYAYLEPIQTFKLRTDLPDELYNLDILDGSPPCSSFSMAGNREKDWGKEKKFRVTLENGTKVDFGAKGYSDYTIHKDPERMKRYLARHKKRENWTRSGMNTAGFWSRWLLWSKPSLGGAKKLIEKKFSIDIV